MIYVYGPRNHAPRGVKVINVTSRSDEEWSRTLSPFYLGPVKLYGGFSAVRMENAWQFTKVYSQHIDEEGEPSARYWEWARAGWKSNWANRYPMGKGAIPLFSLWKDKKLSYVQARKKVYIPLYAECVRKTAAWRKLQHMYEKQDDIAFWDFDGYDRGDMSWDEVVKCESRKMGHALVLAMMLEGAV